MTLKEYLEDYASEETKQVGYDLIRRELNNIPKEKESGRCSGFRNSQDQLPAALQFRTYFFMGVGAFLILLVFVWFVFSRGTLDEILECFEYIVMDVERNKKRERLSKQYAARRAALKAIISDRASRRNGDGLRL